jgi:hypothetical protein
MTATRYSTEDVEALTRLLSRQYSAVVGNPPYIVVRILR